MFLRGGWQDLLWSGGALRKATVWGEVMTEGEFQYSFGPVPSRRLGKSLGINNIPSKVCTYSCVYCQVGRTTALQIDRRSFFLPRDIFRDVQRRTEAAKDRSIGIDYLTYVPDGEPTVDANLGEGMTLLKSLGLPLGVITNSSLLWRNDVREALRSADWVSLKVDAVRESIWRAINRPHKGIRLSAMLDGILEFAGTFTGILVTETMLVAGLNDSDECLREIARFLYQVRPSVAYVSIPTRPPAEKWVHGPNEDTLIRAHQMFHETVKRSEYLIGDEGDTFAVVGDVENDLLNITAVHPMREEAVRKFLVRAGAVWAVVDRLIARGDLMEATYAGQKFYMKKLKKHTVPME